MSIDIRLSPTTANEPVGVIVGRFQRHRLHDGHRYLFSEVCKRHQDVFVLLGEQPGYLGHEDPLPFDLRKMMIEGTFPGREFTFAALKGDRRNYEERSEKIDTLIQKHFPERNAILYGSRDSAVQKYKGTLPTFEIPTIYLGRSRDTRESIAPIDSDEFRAGYMHCINTLPSIAFATADLAIVDRPNKRAILGGKPHEKKWRFPGGFFELGKGKHADAKDSSHADTALREGKEEVLGVTFTVPQIIGPTVIDDWRYRDTRHGILTGMCVADYLSGMPEPGDDLERVAWFAYDQIMSELVPEHEILGTMLLKHLREQA